MLKNYKFLPKNMFVFTGLYGDNGILPGRTQLNFRDRIPLLQKFKQKPTLLWFAPYLGLNVEYMLNLLTLFGIFISFLG
jgi:hypothetical protein